MPASSAVPERSFSRRRKEIRQSIVAVHSSERPVGYRRRAMRSMPGERLSTTQSSGTPNRISFGADALHDASVVVFNAAV